MKMLDGDWYARNKSTGSLFLLALQPQSVGRRAGPGRFPLIDDDGRWSLLRRRLMII